MNMLEQLLERNRDWAHRMKMADADFFERLIHQQKPQYLWIGCSDSRVPANEIVGMMPGELFVHRNVANLVIHTDLNCLSVLQYAVEYLQVKHIIVCGHYGCGGIHAAVSGERLGLIDNWLRHVQDVRQKHFNLPQVAAGHNDPIVNRICELNVIEQVQNVCRTTIVQEAWNRRQDLTVHGWIYDLGDGLLKDLHITVAGNNELLGAYENAIQIILGKQVY